MNLISWLILAVIAVGLVLAIRSAGRQGGDSCGGTCSGCHSAGSCPMAQTDPAKNDKTDL